jgi:hypothetical protein
MNKYLLHDIKELMKIADKFSVYIKKIIKISSRNDVLSYEYIHFNFITDFKKLNFSHLI